MLFQSLFSKFINKCAANQSALFIIVAVAVLLILLVAVLAPLLFTD